MEVWIKDTMAKLPKGDSEAVVMSRAVLAFRVSAGGTDNAQRESPRCGQSHSSQRPEQGTPRESERPGTATSSSSGSIGTCIPHLLR